MRILLVGAGGVGGAFTAIAARRDFFEAVVVADYDLARAERAAATDARYIAAQVDASDAAAVTALCREHAHHPRDERRRPGLQHADLRGGAGRRAPTTSTWRCRCRSRTPRRRTSRPGSSSATSSSRPRRSGRTPDAWPWWGSGVEPGLSDVFARYAADHLFSEIDELGTRDGANLVVTDDDGNEVFAPSFSMWTTIEECLNPPVVWQDGEWRTTAPFSEPEVFDFPEGIGPVECVNVEHEEVLLMPRWIDCKRATFKYGLGDEFINILKVLHTLGLDRTEKVRVKGVEVSPRDVVAAVLPDPATVGPRMTRQDLRRAVGDRHAARTARRGRPTSTTWSTTSGRCASTATSAWSGRPRSTPSIALELLATGVWSGPGVLGPGGVRRRAVPRPAHRLRQPVGPARAGARPLGSGHEVSGGAVVRR